MKTRVLFVALIALVIAIGSNGFVYAGDKGQEQKQPQEEWERRINKLEAMQKQIFQQFAAMYWNECRIVLSKRGVKVPELDPGFFGHVRESDIGKIVLTTVGPVSFDRSALEEFMSCFKKKDKDYEKAAAILDGGEIRWLKPGVKTELVSIISYSIVAIRPPGAANFIYAPFWSVKPTE